MQTHAAAFADCLYRRGHRISVVTYAQMEDNTVARAYDAQQPFPTFRCLSRLSYWSNVSTLRKLSDRLNPDLIYSSTPFYGILRAITGIPVVCRSVGNDIMRCWIPYPFRLGSGMLANQALERRLHRLYRRLRAPAQLEDVLYKARRRLVQRAAQAASIVVANSHYTRDRLLDLGVNPAATTVIAGGVDSARFARSTQPALRNHLGIEDSQPAILTVCRLVVKKGLDVLLEAAATAGQELPTLALVVVGDGPEREKCKRLADRLGIGNMVHFVGKVPHAQVADYYHAADCFVLASRVHRRRNGWADVETMGRVICEANAAGLPAVVTETGGVASVISHETNGLLVQPDDPTAIADAIVQLWRHPALRTKLRAGGLQRARSEFDWEVVTSAYETVFRQARTEKSLLGGTDSALSSPTIRLR